MDFRSLIIFLNRRCTVGCATCDAGARPGNKDRLSREWLDAFFRRLDPGLFSGYVIWTGGEPFLSFESLCYGIALASGKGYRSEVLTSGVWYETHPELLEQLTRAGDENGTVSLRISLDAEHQEKVPMSQVIGLIEAAGALNLKVNFTLREIPGREGAVQGYMDEIRKHLPDYYRENSRRSRWLHHIPHIPLPDAPVCGDSPPQPHKYRQRCKMIFRDLVIGDDGQVYPCRGFFSLPKKTRRGLALGDPLETSWEVLSARQEQPLFKQLKEQGPYGICKRRKLEPEMWNSAPFYNQCHLCLELFMRIVNC